MRVCDVCSQRPACVRCDEDAANLCSACDATVHSANVLSARHRRFPLCSWCGAHKAALSDAGTFACSHCAPGHPTATKPVQALPPPVLNGSTERQQTAGVAQPLPVDAQLLDVSGDSMQLAAAAIAAANAASTADASSLPVAMDVGKDGAHRFGNGGVATRPESAAGAGNGPAQHMPTASVAHAVMASGWPMQTDETWACMKDVDGQDGSPDLIEVCAPCPQQKAQPGLLGNGSGPSSAQQPAAGSDPAAGGAQQLQAGDDATLLDSLFSAWGGDPLSAATPGCLDVMNGGTPADDALMWPMDNGATDSANRVWMQVDGMSPGPAAAPTAPAQPAPGTSSRSQQAGRSQAAGADSGQHGGASAGGSGQAPSQQMAAKLVAGSQFGSWAQPYPGGLTGMPFHPNPYAPQNGLLGDPSAAIALMQSQINHSPLPSLLQDVQQQLMMRGEQHNAQAGMAGMGGMHAPSKPHMGWGMQGGFAGMTSDMMHPQSPHMPPQRLSMEGSTLSGQQLQPRQLRQLEQQQQQHLHMLQQHHQQQQEQQKRSTEASQQGGPPQDNTSANPLNPAMPPGMAGHMMMGQRPHEAAMLQAFMSQWRPGMVPGMGAHMGDPSAFQGHMGGPGPSWAQLMQQAHAWSARPQQGPRGLAALHQMSQFSALLASQQLGHPGQAGMPLPPALQHMLHSQVLAGQQLAAQAQAQAQARGSKAAAPAVSEVISPLTMHPDHAPQVKQEPQASSSMATGGSSHGRAAAAMAAANSHLAQQLRQQQSAAAMQQAKQAHSQQGPQLSGQHMAQGHSGESGHGKRAHDGSLQHGGSQQHGRGGMHMPQGGHAGAPHNPFFSMFAGAHPGHMMSHDPLAMQAMAADWMGASLHCRPDLMGAAPMQFPMAAMLNMPRPSTMAPTMASTRPTLSGGGAMHAHRPGHGLSSMATVANSQAHGGPSPQGPAGAGAGHGQAGDGARFGAGGGAEMGQWLGGRAHAGGMEMSGLAGEQHAISSLGLMSPAAAGMLAEVSNVGHQGGATAAHGDRGEALTRYRQKRKLRHFEKTIRYASRQVRAHKRPRVKGRFVKGPSTQLGVVSEGGPPIGDMGGGGDLGRVASTQGEVHLGGGNNAIEDGDHVRGGGHARLLPVTTAAAGHHHRRHHRTEGTPDSGTDVDADAEDADAELSDEEEDGHGLVPPGAALLLPSRAGVHAGFQEGPSASAVAQMRGHPEPHTRTPMQQHPPNSIACPAPAVVLGEEVQGPSRSTASGGSMGSVHRSSAGGEHEGGPVLEAPAPSEAAICFASGGADEDEAEVAVGPAAAVAPVSSGARSRERRAAASQVPPAMPAQHKHNGHEGQGGPARPGSPQRTAGSAHGSGSQGHDEASSGSPAAAVRGGGKAHGRVRHSSACRHTSAGGQAGSGHCSVHHTTSSGAAVPAVIRGVEGGGDTGQAHASPAAHLRNGNARSSGHAPVAGAARPSSPVQGPVSHGPAADSAAEPQQAVEPGAGIMPVPSTASCGVAGAVTPPRRPRVHASVVPLGAGAGSGAGADASKQLVSGGQQRRHHHHHHHHGRGSDVHTHVRRSHAHQQHGSMVMLVGSQGAEASTRMTRSCMEDNHTLVGAQGGSVGGQVGEGQGEVADAPAPPLVTVAAGALAESEGQGGEVDPGAAAGVDGEVCDSAADEPQVSGASNTCNTVPTSVEASTQALAARHHMAGLELLTQSLVPHTAEQHADRLGNAGPQLSQALLLHEAPAAADGS